MNETEVIKKIHLVISNIDCIALEDFKDKGSPCIDWFGLSPTENKKLSETKALVEIVMPKRSAWYTTYVSKILANATGNQYVWYDWAVKTLSRIISGCTFNELNAMINLSNIVKKKMQQIRLTEINNLQEIFV